MIPEINNKFKNIKNMRRQISKLSLIFQAFNKLPNGHEFTIQSLYYDYLTKLSEDNDLQITEYYTYGIIMLLRRAGYCSKLPKVSKVYSKIKDIESDMTLTTLQIKSNQTTIDNGEK